MNSLCTRFVCSRRRSIEFVRAPRSDHREVLPPQAAIDRQTCNSRGLMNSSRLKGQIHII